MNVGFTGTHRGMNKKQEFRLERLLYQIWEKDEDATHQFHDGMCMGADTQAHQIALVHSCYFDIKFHGHPLRMYGDISKDVENDELFYDKRNPRRPALMRRRYIVDSSDVMFATPRLNKEELYDSYTWYTIRYAWEINKKLYIVWPDGTFDLTYIKDPDE